MLDDLTTLSDNNGRVTPLRAWRVWAWCSVLGPALLLLLLVMAPSTHAQSRGSTIPSTDSGGPMLINPGFECSEGTYALSAAQGGEMRIPVGWSVRILDGTPWLYSASMQYNGGACGGGAHVEKIEGGDSLALFAHDLEWTDQPGKPFDAAIYQEVNVTPGVAYSLSGWMLSLCGGSTMPNDCPEGYYMAKLLGIDPTGGTDPLADTVIWVENRRNFVENGERVGWQNLQVSAVAQAETITVFGRIRSPFQWHGNHAFVDAFSLMEAPEAHFVNPPQEMVESSQIELTWQGDQSAAIELIPAGAYQIRFDVQYRVGEAGEWTEWLRSAETTGQLFTAKQAETPHFLRLRARAEQLPGGPGAWPNHRYVGVWSEPIQISFRQAPQYNVYLPGIQRGN